jgi:hypothetical protein
MHMRDSVIKTTKRGRKLSWLSVTARARTVPLVTLVAASLLAPRVRAAAAVNIAGGWTGAFDVTSEFGEQKHYTDSLALEQNGTVVSGSFGLGNSPLTPILHGRVHGSMFTFSIAIRGSLQMDFRLQLSGNQLAGSGVCTTDLGRVIAKVSDRELTYLR